MEIIILDIIKNTTSKEALEAFLGKLRANQATFEDGEYQLENLKLVVKKRKEMETIINKANEKLNSFLGKQ